MSPYPFLLTAALLAASTASPTSESPVSCHPENAASGLNGAAAASQTDAPEDGKVSISGCDPRTGFELGLRNKPALEDCPDREHRMNFELGRQIRALREEQISLNTADPASADRSTADARLRIIERELSQLEGLARIRGLPVADPVPGQETET